MTSSAKRRVVVTGGAGFIGSHLVDVLAASQDGYHVMVLDDFSTGHRENVAHHKKNVEVIDGDIRDRQLLSALLEDCELVFHLACRGVRHSIGRPFENHEVNATGTLNLLQEAYKAKVKRFIHVSSSEVYGTARTVPMDEYHACFPETVYGAAKLAGECYARAYFRTYGFPVVVVRPFNNFGPRSHFEGDSGEVIPRFCVLAINGRQPIIYGDGSQTRDFIYVEDTAHWLLRIAHCDDLVGATLNLGSGRETSILELASTVCSAVGRPDLKPRFQSKRPGDVHRLLADATLARQTLGFELRTSLHTGLEKLLQHLRERFERPEELLQWVSETNWQSIPTG